MIAVKTYGEVLPDVGVAVLPEALVVESVDLRDLAGLVVATEDGDALAEADLKQKNTFNFRSHGIAAEMTIACTFFVSETFDFFY